MTYRRIDPSAPRDLALVMLYEPLGGGGFARACEADGWSGLVAALISDTRYEDLASPQDRLVRRLQLGENAKLFFAVHGNDVEVVDFDGPTVINIASDETLIRSLQRLGFLEVRQG